MVRWVAYLFSGVVVLSIIGAIAGLVLVQHYSKGLPDYQALEHYQPPVTTRVYAGDGRLAAEYAIEKRSFVPIAAVPDRVRHAFMSAEDKNFYSHSGIDFTGIVRAALTNIKNRSVGSDRRPVGASTITQQVAKNFFLTNEASLERKIKEAILAFRIEQTFSKDRILELYLNEIYLGQSAYGVAAAATVYFNKSLDELSIAEAAYLAALPKGPANYDPQRYPEAARGRRDWVIGRMLDDGAISADEAQKAWDTPLVTSPRRPEIMVEGGEYFAEDIRRIISSTYGEQALYKGGLSVRSTLDPRLQAIATRTLKEGLSGFDRRHGWRGPLASLPTEDGWSLKLAALPQNQLVKPWRTALVLSMTPTYAEIGLTDGAKARLMLDDMKWARPVLPSGAYGPTPKKPDDVLKIGDVIAVELIPAKIGKDGKPEAGSEKFALRQIPKVEGALIALDPHTGRVLAMQGGFSYQKSEFNRATQALRQPGSAFKPFVYLTALENGYTPSSLVLDGPVTFDQGPGLPKWTPKNYSGDFLGPTTLRVGIEKSRNLMTVRLAAALGMEKVATMAETFGVVDRMPRQLAASLGAVETTPLRMAAGYAQIVNGGQKITPTLIDRIQDRTGATIYRHDERACINCRADYYSDQDMPTIPDNRLPLVDPISAYQMTHILEGVVQRGTATRVSAVGKPLAGKTGTSNDSKDVWFVGFSPDLVVAVFVGYDEPASLGSRETGSSIAAPIFRDFMIEALKDKPGTPFRAPPGVRMVRVNPATGRVAGPDDSRTIYEAFKPEATPFNTSSEVTGDEPSMVGMGFGDLSGALSNSYDDGVSGEETTPMPPETQPAPLNYPVRPPILENAFPPLFASPPSAQTTPQAGGLY